MSDWTTMNAWQRNWLMGEMMKAEPLRAYYLRWQGKDFGQLRVKSEAEAQSWLRIARLGETQWKKLIEEVPWALRDEVTIHVDSWHIRYSDTPGGGWEVVEWLRGRGEVKVESVADQWRVVFDDGKPHHGRISVAAPTMAEAACLVALRQEGRA